MSGGSRMPLAVCAVLAALLLAGALAFGAGSTKPPPPPKRPGAATRIAPVPVIARRVEQIRGLRFRRIPKPRTIGGKEASRAGLADLDRSYPEAARRADEEVYKLLGLLRPRDDLRKISASVYGEQVAGYYDPRSKALRIVQSAAPPDPVNDETTLAHELTHALEDQRFKLDLDDAGASGDRALAYTAMVEGTATALMTEYQRRHFTAEQALGSAAVAAGAAPSTASLPPFITAQLLFPYLDGQAFISRLYATAGDTWKLVDVAERVRPPASTEQILHPDKYLRLEAPERVRLGGVRAALGPGWRRATAQTFGEWQTRELLQRGVSGSEAARAAAGWGGDSFELWRRGPAAGRGCPAPCVRDDVLVMRWRWDTPRDAREFVAALRGGGAPRALSGGAVVVTATGARETTLVLAPDARLARRVARVRP